MLKRTTENFLEAQDLEERGSQSLLCTAPPPQKKGADSGEDRKGSRKGKICCLNTGCVSQRARGSIC